MAKLFGHNDTTPCVTSDTPRGCHLGRLHELDLSRLVRALPLRRRCRRRRGARGVVGAEGRLAGRPRQSTDSVIAPVAPIAAPGRQTLPIEAPVGRLCQSACRAYRHPPSVEWSSVCGILSRPIGILQASPRWRELLTLTARQHARQGPSPRESRSRVRV